MNKPPPNLDEAFEKAIWFLGFWGIEENARQIRKERERVLLATTPTFTWWCGELSVFFFSFQFSFHYITFFSREEQKKKRIKR